MAEEEHLIQASELRKEYRHKKLIVSALRSATFTVDAGEKVVLMGPSGSGKSTLLNLLGGLDRPSGGTLTVAGKNLATTKDREAAAYRQTTVGMIFQSFNLLAHLTVLQNVILPAVLAGKHRSGAIRRAQELFERVRISDKSSRLPDELSGGEQQRVAIVRALMNEPRVLLADEPTGNLDSKTGADIMRLLIESTSETAALIVVTHDERLAVNFDRKLIISDGVLDARGPGI